MIKTQNSRTDLSGARVASSKSHGAPVRSQTKAIEMSTRPDYLATLAERVLVFDGAMGTSIQGYDLTAEDFGGKEGCNDYLALTRPDVIRAIHASFLAVGCDVLETDTFNATRLRLADYGLGH